MVALQELVRTRYLDTVRSTQPANSRWKILVVDAFTKLHLNHVLKVYDILEEGVQQIDQLEQGRARNPNMEALYIVLPTTDNVERICQDFFVPPIPKPNKRDKNPQPPPTPQPPRYGAAHICFIGGIPDHLFDRLAAEIPEHQLRAVKELYVHFWAIESHVFSIKSPQAFHTFYAPPKRSAREAVDAAEDELRFTAQSLVNVLAILGEYPVIRYYKSNQKPIGVGVAYNEHITRRLAEMVQEGMDKYCRDNENFPPKPDPPRQRGALLITDRSMDLSAPLLHEFTYQAMINDLLDVEDEGKLYKHSFRNAAGVLEEKDVILTEEDEIWAETRHMHMKDALDKLIADFKQYAGDYQQKFGGEGQSSINDMKDMLASLDATRKSKDSLSAHLSLAEKCMGFFEKNKLPAVADVEQCCATGVTSEGKAPRTLVEDMVPLLGERSLSSKDKIRIIALYILFRDGVPEEDRKRLFQHARLALHEMDMVNNLKFLGLDISKELKTSRKPPLRQRQQDDVYDISRYQPIIKLMLDDYCADRLDTIAFPYIRDAPPSSVRNSAASAAAGGSGGSLRSSRPNWAERAKAKPVKEPRQRIVVFQLGGITYSEVRAAYQVSQASNRDVFIGSSHIITPKAFLQDLSNMDRGGAATMGSAAAPDIARYDKYRELSKGDKTPRPTAQEGFDNRFPFVAANRPSAERAASAAQVPQVGPGSSHSGPGSHLPPGVRPTIQTANSYSGMPSQHSAGSDGSASPFAMPKMQRQGSFSRIIHPGRSAGPSSLANAVQYDDNMNVIQNPGKSSKQQQQVQQQSLYVPSPQGSRAPSIASTQGGEGDGKKKRNFLKKAFS